MKQKHIRHSKEADEQEAFFRWVAWAQNAHPELEMFFHVPNGGKRDSSEAAHMKRLGVRAGVPDLILPAAASGFHGLFIELKAQGGRTTAEQKKWIERLRAAGYRAEVCVGWISAVKTVCEYLKIKPPEGLR